MPHRITLPDILGTVGHTPLVWLKRVVPAHHGKVLVKCEFFNPLSSVKDRIGRAMIEAAEQSGELKEGSHIIEPTSGNTGIALAFVAAAKGYRLTLTIPDSMSHERRALLLGLARISSSRPRPRGSAERFVRPKSCCGIPPIPGCLDSSKILPTREFTKQRRGPKSGLTRAATSMSSWPAWEPVERSQGSHVTFAQNTRVCRPSPWNLRSRP